MDSADLFRHLLTTKTLPEKTRSDYEFGFRTVFYIHGSSYCCCRCAYDHEYFTYISNTGEIDKDKFDKLAKAVECGYCEHAIRFKNKDYLKETKVYATHVLAALGSEDMVEVVASVLDGNGLPKQKWPPNRNCYPRDYKHTGLFELTPCDIGCLKHNGKALHLVDYIECDKRITCAEEIASNVLHFDKIFFLQFCFRKQFDILNREIDALEWLRFKKSLELPSIHATVYPYTYDGQYSELEILLRILVKYKLSRDQVRIAMEQISDPQNINKRNKEGLTFLQSYICKNKCVEVSYVRTLIKLGANIDMPLARKWSVATNSYTEQYTQTGVQRSFGTASV